MRAIILAAGRGTRLAGVTGDNPKCLMPLGGRPLIERQIESIRSCGISAITAVVGYQAARVEEACGLYASAIDNPRFAETNSLYSLWLAREALHDGFVVLNADVLFHTQLLCDLVSSRYEDALLVGFRGPGDGALGDEEMKVKVRGGLVADIAKTLPPGDADGENVGIAKFGARGAHTLVEQLDALVAAGHLREWAPRAFREFARLRPLHAIGTRGFPWIEIDFPDDYHRAAGEVLPLIETPSPVEEAAMSLPPPLAAASDSTGAEWRPHSGHV
ncbi:MAG: phosphocholine cytidylyltransferase family protein [Acidobacteria bacterium]|nr:MAG: phosphocholine cytidylyltransferase family protein [Acidobacteriota bacterium]RPJ76469.1 MAG: phosphocholine cytidylyltransferase family protein [Acidobacteriota bacterium]